VILWIDDQTSLPEAQKVTADAKGMERHESTRNCVLFNMTRLKEVELSK
jgi:hypothetical protein